VQITGFVTLAMVHFGLVSGYGNEDAGATESVIALALFVAFLLTWRSPPRHRRAATAVQLLAGLGVLAGFCTVALGLERPTILELALNVGVLLTVVVGLVATRRWHLGGAGTRNDP
jgi:heme A synthase